MPTQKQLDYMVGHKLITNERFRQVDEEGWTPEQDFRRHMPRDLARAAIAYIANAAGLEAFIRVDKFHEGRRIGQSFVDPWPKHWNKTFDKRKKHDHQRSAEIGGALCAALIDLIIVRAGGATSDDDTKPLGKGKS